MAIKFGWILLLLGIYCRIADGVSVLKDRASVDDKKYSPTSYLVTNLPGLLENIPDDHKPLMFAGQLELHPENQTNYFFWSFKQDENGYIPKSNRTIFWLNGGPGCSSMDGALMEVGPLRVNNQNKVIYNPGSWHEVADIVFVDQPVNTGFSYGSVFSHELDEITWTFLKFMEEYFKIFPEERDNEIYFAGESYAGQYIPYIGNRILEHNKGNSDNRYNLKGLLIGNGWISPNEQSMSYIPFCKNAGLIDEHSPAWANLLRKQEKCQNIVNKIDSVFDEHKVNEFETNSDLCESILTDILAQVRPEQQCINMYDYRLTDLYPQCGSNWPPDVHTVTPFLNLPEVQSHLNLVYKPRWRECSGSVTNRFRARNSLPSIHLFKDILAEIPIILFHGDKDIICNTMGAQNMIKKLEWNGAKGFSESTPEMDWDFNGTISGFVKLERNLTYINMYNSSHMVPFDHPELSRSLIDLMIGNYNVTQDNDKTTLNTFTLKRQWEELQKQKAPIEDDNTTSDSDSNSNSNLNDQKPDPTDNDGDSTPSNTGDNSSETENTATGNRRFTRIIQLLVIVVVIWSIYVLYASYKSRPQSIIKTNGKQSNRKKIVQWADQIETTDPLHPTQEPSFIKRTFNKIFGVTRGHYTSVGPLEDIELGENILHNVADDFIITSDDEYEEGTSSSSSNSNSPTHEASPDRQLPEHPRDTL